MVRKAKFIIGKSKSSRLEQRILGYNRQLTNLHTKVELVSAWITRKFGVLFLVGGSARVELKDVSNYISLLKSTAQHSLNPRAKKNKEKRQSTSDGKRSCSDNSKDSDAMVLSDAGVGEADDDQSESTVREPVDGRIPLEDGAREMERRVPRHQRKSKVDNEMAMACTQVGVGATQGQEGNGTKEKRPKRTLPKRNFQAPDKRRQQKHSCNWPNCNKYFNHKSNLVRHQRTHTGEKPFNCTWPSCGKSFKTSFDCSRHRRTHTGEKPYVCNWPNCGKSFAGIGNLKSHRLTHTGERPYICNWPDCDKSFSQSGNLQLHTRRAHTGERPFNCGFCEYEGASSSDLTSHIRIHTGEKPFKCRVCPSTFKHTTQRFRHEKVHRQNH